MKKTTLNKSIFFSLFLLLSTLFSCDFDSTGSTSSNNSPNSPIFSDNSTKKDKSKKDEVRKDKNIENQKNEDDTKDSNSNGETIKVLSWNLYNFGKSKEAKEIEYIAKKLKDYDIVAVQEVSTSLYGIRAVGKLADELNRTGSKWEYKISEPTSGDGKERYAYLWKTATKNAKISLKKDWLEESIEAKVDREPYMARFEIVSKSKAKNTILLASFHAVPTTKNPENEIVYLEEIPNRYKTDNILIMGDFNLDGKHKAFDVLRNRSFVAAFEGQKTSLRMKEKDGDPLNEEYDNIFVETRAFSIKKAEVIHFYKDYNSLKEARYISDHIPIWVELGFK